MGSGSGLGLGLELGLGIPSDATPVQPRLVGDKTNVASDAVELGPTCQTVQHDEVAERGALAAKLSCVVHNRVAVSWARRVGAAPGVTRETPRPVHVTRLAPALAAAAARGGANTVAAHVAWLDGVISIDVADGVLVVEAALSRRPEPIGGFDGLRLLDLLLIGNVPFDGVRMVEERVVVNGSGAVARLRAVVPGGGGVRLAVWALPGEAEAVGMRVLARPLGECIARRANGQKRPAVMPEMSIEIVELAHVSEDAHRFLHAGLGNSECARGSEWGKLYSRLGASTTGTRASTPRCRSSTLNPSPEPGSCLCRPAAAPWSTSRFDLHRRFQNYLERRQELHLGTLRTNERIARTARRRML